MSKEKAPTIKTIVHDGVKEVKEWKSKLTAALDDTVLLISLSLLGGFYVTYTFTNYLLGGNTRDQDTITSGCSCRFTARVLYRLWFTVFLMIWIFVYSYIPLERTFQGFIHCVPKCREAWDLIKWGNRMEAVRKFCWKLCSRCCKRCCKLCYKLCCKRCCCNSDCCKIQTDDDDHESAYNKKILLYQYYTLYIMGYTDTTKLIKPSQPNQQPGHVHDKGHDDKRPSQSTDEDDEVSNCFSSGSSCKNIICSITIRNFIRAMLLFLKYFSQLVTVPLLMLQIFDTYALLCFAPNYKYCGDLSEYRIHLLQVAITVFFYFSIASAQLTTTLLEWAPLETSLKKFFMLNYYYDNRTKQQYTDDTIA